MLVSLKMKLYTKFSHCKYTVHDQVGRGTDKSKKGDNLHNQINVLDHITQSWLKMQTMVVIEGNSQLFVRMMIGYAASNSLE